MPSQATIVKNLQETYEICRKDFYMFVGMFCRHMCKADTPDFHIELYNDVPHNPRMVVAAPRGHAKSTIISVFYPLWLLVYGHAKDICIVSASEALAIELMRKIRYEIEHNQLINTIFGDLSSDKWTENHLVLTNKSVIRAKGAGGQIRGFRPDTLIIDDLETSESANSEDLRKKNREWILKDCLNTLMPDGQFIMIGTLYNNVCVLNQFLTADNGWTKRIYRAYQDGIQEKGHELWAGLWSHEKLQQRKREIGSWAFACEYMNDPVSDESAPIKETMIRYWENLPQEYSLAIAVDPAYSEDDHSDWKTASLVAIDKDSNRYLIDYIRTHAPQAEFMSAILNMWQMNKTRISGIGVPASGVEKSFYNSLVAYATRKNLFPCFIELKNSVQSSTGTSIRNKKARIITTLQPLFEQGKYYIHKNHIEAREELLTIGSSRWDDIVDTMTYAEQVLQPNFFPSKQVVYNYSDSSRSNNHSDDSNHEGCYGI